MKTNQINKLAQFKNRPAQKRNLISIEPIFSSQSAETHYETQIPSELDLAFRSQAHQLLVRTNHLGRNKQPKIKEKNRSIPCDSYNQIPSMQTLIRLITANQNYQTRSVITQPNHHEP